MPPWRPLFKVRYWDYSKQPFNLNGYICLTSSLAWGAFSILLVRFLHPPVEDLVLRLPAFLVDPLAFLLTIAVTVDAVRSFQAAMDLREVLTRLTEENEDLRRLAKRVEVISAFAEEDLRRFRERTEVERLLRQERWEDTRRQIQEAYAKGARRRQAQLEESLRRRTDAKLTALANIQEALEAYRDRLAAARDLTEESLEARRAEVQQLLDRLRDRKLPSAPAPPGVIASPCASCGATPPPAPKPLPRPWSPCGKLGDRRGGRTANEESRRNSPCSAERPLVPYGADFPSFRVPFIAILHLCLNRRLTAAQPKPAALSIRMAAWTCSPQRAGPREIQNPPDAQGIDCDAHHRPRDVGDGFRVECGPGAEQRQGQTGR